MALKGYSSDTPSNYNNRFDLSAGSVTIPGMRIDVMPTEDFLKE
jgi:hypothetical protein